MSGKRREDKLIEMNWHGLVFFFAIPFNSIAEANDD